MKIKKWFVSRTFWNPKWVTESHATIGLATNQVALQFFRAFICNLFKVLNQNFISFHTLAPPQSNYYFTQKGMPFSHFSHQILDLMTATFSTTKDNNWISRLQDTHTVNSPFLKMKPQVCCKTTHKYNISYQHFHT